MQRVGAGRRLNKGLCARSQLGQKVTEVWVSAFKGYLGDVKPAHRVKFLGIKGKRLVARASDRVPERDVGVTARQADRLGHGDHEGRTDLVRRRFDPEFLKKLSQDGCPGILARLDVPTGREPTPGVFVVHQQDVFTIDNGKV